MTKFLTSGNARSYRLYRNVSNQLVLGISDDGSAETTVSSTATAGATQWYFLVGRFKPSTEMAVWVNAVKATNTTSIPASIDDNASDFNLGIIDDGTGSGGVLTGRASVCFLAASALPDDMIGALFQQSRALYGV